MAAFLDLVSGRRGHFDLESGLHAGLWLDLDSLFCDTAKAAPFIDALSAALGPFRPEAICGPRQGGAVLAKFVAASLGTEFLFTERVANREGEGTFRARYAFPAELEGLARGRRIAIVDDVMSAGSSLRATRQAVEGVNGTVIAAGALVVLGRIGADYFAHAGIPVVAPLQEPF